MTSLPAASVSGSSSFTKQRRTRNEDLRQAVSPPFSAPTPFKTAEIGSGSFLRPHNDDAFAITQAPEGCKLPRPGERALPDGGCILSRLGLHLKWRPEGGGDVVTTDEGVLWGSVRLHTPMFSIWLFIQSSWLGIIGQTNECHGKGMTGAAASLQRSPC